MGGRSAKLGVAVLKASASPSANVCCSSIQRHVCSIGGIDLPGTSENIRCSSIEGIYA